MPSSAMKNIARQRRKIWRSFRRNFGSQRAADILPADQTKNDFRQDAGSTLFHRWRDGERDNVQLLEAYAFLLSGVIDLYEATLEPKHLDFAIALAEAMIAKFYDTENGGFWQSAGRREGFDFAREGRLRRRGTIRQFRRHACAVETGRHHRARGFQEARRGHAAVVRASPAEFPAGHAVHAARAGFPARRTPPRRHRRQSASTQKRANCCAPHIRFISRTRSCLATPARLRNLPGLCPPKTVRWFIFALEIPASRRRRMRRR